MFTSKLSVFGHLIDNFFKLKSIKTAKDLHIRGKVKTKSRSSTVNNPR